MPGALRLVVPLLAAEHRPEPALGFGVMTAVPEIEIDLDVAAEERWASLHAWRSSARALLRFYVTDLGGLQDFRPILMSYCEENVDKEYVAEMRGVARVLEAPEEEVVLANLYYDALKFLLGQGPLGCTGFVVSSSSGLFHARNLDWTTADGLLASETVVFSFRRGPGPILYRTVGWPGFIGCFSGVAPGRFAVTLNAVLSDDRPELAPPITFVLRRALETMPRFDEALGYLRDTRVASDSLLLLSGVRPGEAAVIERSPTRAAVRTAGEGLLIVTNDYRALSTSARGGDAVLAATSCSRYERAEVLLRDRPPKTASDCLAILRDPAVRMGITAQHLVLEPSTGEVSVMRGSD